VGGAGKIDSHRGWGGGKSPKTHTLTHNQPHSTKAQTKCNNKLGQLFGLEKWGKTQGRMSKRVSSYQEIGAKAG